MSSGNPVRLAAMAALLALGAMPRPLPADTGLLPGFRRSPWWDEQVREERHPSGARLLYNAPARVDPARPTLVVVYAAPNGSSAERTLGSAVVGGTDWRFDIQHAAAQVRRLRELDRERNVVLVCAQADERSWPAWRRRQADPAGEVRRMVSAAAARFAPGARVPAGRAAPGIPTRLALTGHSGGGSFLFAYLEAGPVPPEVERIAFLDAVYSFTPAHGERLREWLAAGPPRRLLSLAYDDREITVNGKKVVGPDGGTFRATGRMVAHLAAPLRLRRVREGVLETHASPDGRVRLWVVRNPENRILHTALVGEWNGLLQVLTDGTPLAGAWGRFGGPRAYTAWIEPVATTIPPRPAEAPGGREFMLRIAALPPGCPPGVREEGIAAELLRGNVPQFLRRFAAVTLRARGPDGREHTARLEAMPDYLAVGSDADFARVPMTPMTAQRVADRFGCSLTTRKLADDLFRAAVVKLPPRPLTVEREAVTTFLQHHELIEEQRRGREPGLLVAGIKKDVVLTNRLNEQPRRVAIYGWHYPQGHPIQPLTIVHRDTYVDYSHGIRLVRQAMTVDGRPAMLRDVLQDPELAGLVSDEGPICPPAYLAPQ